MRLSTAVAIGVAAGSSILPTVYGWGAAGHEIVATIAQIYLQPKVLPIICDILDLPLSSCHLAPISTWADRERMRMRWSAALHYVGAVDDHPSGNCAYPGTQGWQGSKGANVLDGIKNVTGILAEWSGKGEGFEKRIMRRGEPGPLEEEALKFLVHFLGDVHQPLHLTGRDRGGNSDKVLFDGRHTNLHSAWDTSIIAKFIRTVPRNYSQPLPYPQVENALRGTIYDAYVRRIMWEGVLPQWNGDFESWFECDDGDSITDKGTVFRQGESSLQHVLEFFLPRGKERIEISPDGPIICPYKWSQPTHALNCDIVWPKELGFAGYGIVGPLIELDTPEYTGVIAQQMIVEKLLAQGGIRLAGVLNWLFGDEAGGLNVPRI